MEIIIAVVIAVLGWFVNDLFARRAQHKAFLNSLRNDARIEITRELKKYYVLLHDIFWLDSYLNEKTRGYSKLEGIGEFVDITHKLHTMISSFELRPSFVSLLEEYETLLPATETARDVLYKNHAKLEIKFSEIGKGLSTAENDLKRFIAFQKIDGVAVAAQKWLVQDLLIIIQNMTLGEFTGNKVEQWGFNGSCPVRHPRFILRKNKIIFKKFE